MEDNQISITDPTDTGGSKREPKAFSYDFAYDWTSSQEGVHLDLGAPIVEKALQGYNGKSSLVPGVRLEIGGWKVCRIVGSPRPANAGYLVTTEKCRWSVLMSVERGCNY